MKISLNEIKKLVKISISDQELIELIGSRLVEIEEVIDLAPKYKGAKIVKVVSCEDIPDTHLHLCQIDTGEGTVQVVCGAPNVHSGMLAVWLAPGTIVPQTYGNENFRLGTRKLQGYESNGMLAGADELDFATEHISIAEIDPKLAQAGDDFAEVFELNDLILDVENKSLTHRPDCFGLIGFAREVAGILGQEFVEPEWNMDGIADSQATPVSISLDPDLCPRYSCAVFELGDNTPSKFLTKNAVFLAKAGMRAIDPMVDVTNTIMLMTGQPLHAFDYDKFVAVGGSETPKIIVRAAKDSEALQLLDGKTIKCIPEDILITSNNVPVALAGAMGGKSTEIDASTRRVLLESATFSLFHLRKTQMAHGIFSEAITRFTKGLPAAMTLPVLLETIQELDVAPLGIADEYPEKAPQTVVKITTLEINQLLGTNYDKRTIIKTLTNVGFGVSGDAELTVTAPLWRTDIHIKEDVIEEVGRLLGFDNIALDLPTKKFTGTEITPLWQFKQEIRRSLSDRLGANELLTYSFISKDLLTKVGLSAENSYEITNSISPELQCFRQQIVPSLLDKVLANQKAGFKKFSLYELNQVSIKSSGLTSENVPVMENHLGLVNISDFYAIKSQILNLFKDLKISLSYSAMGANSAAASLYPYLEPQRSAVITRDGVVVGAFGEVKQAVLRRFKLEPAVSAAELNLDAIVDLPKQLGAKAKLSRFPFVERDLTLKVSHDAEFGRFYNQIDSVLSSDNLIFITTPVSIYQASPEDATKNISFHLKFSNPNKTLDQAEISAIMDEVTVEVVKLGAEIV